MYGCITLCTNIITDHTLDFLGAGVPFLPQSPRQSILNDHPEDARSVIARMHAIPLDDPLVQAYMDEIAAKIVEEKVSGAGYLDCFNFRNDLKTGQRTLIGCGIFHWFVWQLD
jgi:MFS transporter, SP family, sugar:H+ symporter